jgi:hypothetical protein
MLLLIFIYNIFLVFGLNLFFSDYEFTSRVASFSNAVISMLGGSLYIMNMIDINIFQYFIIYNAVYTSTDIVLYVTNKVSNNDILEMMIHHVFFLIGGYCSYNLYIEPIYYAYGMMSETSTVFLNTRWFGHHKYIPDSTIYTTLFWISFLIFRIINMIYISYSILNSSYNYYFVLVFPFVILNSIWFYKLTIKLFMGKSRLL